MFSGTDFLLHFLRQICQPNLRKLIATAKPTADEMHGIKHYMIGFLPADKTYSVADYVLSLIHI